MTLAASPNALVDVIVPVYNHPELVAACIGRMASTTSVPYRLTLIDDGSPDPQTKAYLLTQGAQAKLMWNRENMGFPATVNKAAKVATSRYLCILNSDTEPLPGWLDMLVADLEANPNHAVASPLLLFHPQSQAGPAGACQHAGIFFDVQRRPIHRYIGWPASHARVREYRDDLQAVSGACMLIRRSVWDQVGGFDQRYGRGTFEDIDFCVTVRNTLQRKIVYVPDAMLYHHVGASAVDSGGYPLQINFNLFLAKLGGLVKYDEWSVCG